MKFADEVNIIVDWDTCLIRSCTICQDPYSVFDKDGEFVCSATSIKQWEKDNPKLNKNDFIFDNTKPVLKELEDGDIFWRAIHAIKQEKKRIIKLHQQMPELKKKKLNFFWYLQGDGNYRLDVYPDYKGNRNTPVLLRKKLIKYCLSKFDDCYLIEGCEVDDHVSTLGYASYQRFKKYGEYDTVISHVDKDINCIPCVHSNYDKGTLYELTPEEGFQFFCWQLLVGDSVDNIKGLNKEIPENSYWWFEQEERCQKTLRRSIGKGTATDLLAEYLDPKDCLKLVTEAYMEAHGDNWLAALQEEAIALRMRHYPNEMYDIEKTLQRFEII